MKKWVAIVFAVAWAAWTWAALAAGSCCGSKKDAQSGGDAGSTNAAAEAQASAPAK